MPSIDCPYCGKTIEGDSQTDMGWEYSAHTSQCPKNPANQPKKKDK